jgi:very-short-patch-repair endonuclease
VADFGFGWPSRDRETLIRSAITTWRDGLINLTGSNRLLNFKPSRTGMIRLVRPAPEDVWSRLAANGGYGFRSLQAGRANHGAGREPGGAEPDEEFSVPPPAADILDTDKPSEDLAAALRTLYRRSNQDYLDRGVWVLYLAFGALTWIDEDRTHYTSPLLLVPVQLEHAGNMAEARLKRAPEECVVNPALALKLSRWEINLPRADDYGDLEDISLTGVLGSVRAAIARQEGWQVNDSLVLSYFSFAKEAMYRDLLDHEGQIAAHPVIGALAAGGRGETTSQFYFDEIPEDEVDRRAAPENTPVILDADSSQRACIAAALDGRSFVMDGPPGTGKSQTIANMIGVLLHAGKTVLFVSEKAAALDVVRDRLDEAGLRSYLLELHSHKATRKEVATTLGTALDTVPVAPGAMSVIDVDTARKRREELNAYADAMNRPRDPLSYSLHDLLGMIAQLRDVPAAPATGIAPVDLTVEAFNEIRATAQRLSGAWRPASQGRSFIWRGVQEQGSLDSCLYQAESALRTLNGMTLVNGTLAETFGLTHPSDAAVLAMLLDHLSRRPAGVPEDWLISGTLDAVSGAADELATRLADIEVCEEEICRITGITWAEVPSSTALPVVDRSELTSLIPPAVELDSLSAPEIGELSNRFAADADMLQEHLRSLSGLAAALGLRAPQTFQDAGDLLRVISTAQESNRPERAWLSAQGLEAAGYAAHVLQEAWQTLARAETEASAYYTSAVLREDVESLASRFDSEHHGLGKLSGDYRADKKTVAAFTREGTNKDDSYKYLWLAVGWKRAADALSAAETAHFSILGAYYAASSTDWNQLAEVLTLAGTAVRAARGQDLDRAADFIARDAAPEPAITRVANDTSLDLNAWHEFLVTGPKSAARPELLYGTMTDAIGWLRAHLGPMNSAALFAYEVSQAVRNGLTVSQARYVAGLRDAVNAAQTRLGERDAQFSGALGGLYMGVQTDTTAVRAAVEWARSVREVITGTDAPLNPAQAKEAGDAVPVGQLAAAADDWRRAREALLEAFDLARRAHLAAELDDFDNARDLIGALREDIGGKDEWHAYQSCRVSLSIRGLDAAVAFCISERVPSSQVPQVIERALLQELAEHHLQTDPDLSTVRAADRDALVSEYQQLDRALIASATDGIIRVCNARRPRNDFGEAAIIRREAEKKKRHMPVRTLIERTRHVTQAIKPCFMMSPLAVSQYLPPDVTFDVVIFDEASQVSPGDAINCIYRGSALILAGDQKQLPPSNFFAGGIADDDDEWSEDSDDTAEFESILDHAKASGAFRNLTLRWHYRSMHEALIAFSNVYFYEGRLVTFPSRDSDGPDVGVELFWVNGTYRRGTSRDNPQEAAAVAKRVIHHFDTRPGLSLGVVTFSEAQAGAINDAIDRAGQDRPDLKRFFATDRLRGFFIKSLESVQGDERDVMIFSIGYGPDENGKTTMGFGPLNRQGGWRRLNVAITRARYRNEIVSSIRPEDIPESVTNEGVLYLRRYLDYAARGMAALALDTSAGGDAESPFEESVISVIRSWGYEITPQVGTAGYRIDIGVRHPHHPGVYALGIECDGYQYHSSRVARDRDRLREKVLRGLGWNLHRIWGTAWYRDRKGEERRLRAAIEHAITAPVHGLLAGETERGENARIVVQTETATFDQTPTWTTPYVTAEVARLPHWVDPSDPGSYTSMAQGIRSVVMIEAPVHTAVLLQRLRNAWDIGHVGGRIRANIDTATARAGVLRDGEFLTLTSAPVTTVRTPTDACRREVKHVHDHELMLALTNIVRDAGGITHDELTTRAARLYGWTRRGPDISTRLDALVARLIGNGTLTDNEDDLTMPS